MLAFEDEDTRPPGIGVLGARIGYGPPEDSPHLPMHIRNFWKKRKGYDSKVFCLLSRAELSNIAEAFLSYDCARMWGGIHPKEPVWSATGSNDETKSCVIAEKGPRGERKRSYGKFSRDSSEANDDSALLLSERLEADVEASFTDNNLPRSASARSQHLPNEQSRAMYSTEASNRSSRHGSEYTVDSDETVGQADMPLIEDKYRTTEALSTLGHQNALAAPLPDMTERRGDASPLDTNPEDMIDVKPYFKMKGQDFRYIVKGERYNLNREHAPKLLQEIIDKVAHEWIAAEIRQLRAETNGDISRYGAEVDLLNGLCASIIHEASLLNARHI